MQLEAAGGRKEGRGNRVMLFADAAEVLVVLRLHELLSVIAALVHQPLKETLIASILRCLLQFRLGVSARRKRERDLSVGFELLELVELGRFFF